MVAFWHRPRKPAGRAGGSGRTGGTNTLTVSQSGAGGSSVSIDSIRVASGTDGGRDTTAADIRVKDGIVWIDGVRVPDHAVTHTSRGGRRFRIDRSGGRVTVTADETGD